MPKRQIVVATVAILVGAGAAQAIELQQSINVKGAPDALWQKIGDFCAIKDWHPAIKGCEISEADGATFRTLTLPDGGTVREKLVEKTPTGYTYEIVESPLPVQNYRSTFSVAGEGDSSTVTWQATFDAKGASDADSEAVMAGVYKAGLDQISASAGK